jgi:hypothetical protein
MPICGRVVSKPGFSTFAEAVKLEVPIVSMTRDDFAESTFLIRRYYQLQPASNCYINRIFPG